MLNDFKPTASRRSGFAVGGLLFFKNCMLKVLFLSFPRVYAKLDLFDGSGESGGSFLRESCGTRCSAAAWNVVATGRRHAARMVGLGWTGFDSADFATGAAGTEGDVVATSCRRPKRMV